MYLTYFYACLSTYIPIYIQQDATLHSLFISGNCSTCFGWYLLPSSGAHTTVSTASDICHTVTATHSTLKPVPTLPRQRQIAVTVWQISDAVDTVVCAPDDRRRYYPKYVEQFPDINKQCNVASCWIYIYIYIYLFILYIQNVQLKSGPLTKPWIFHVRCYLQWFCWYDIILLHVQELARLLQEREEPVLAIRISWISRQWVLVFEQRHFLRFHNAVNSGRTCIYFGKLFKNDFLRPL